MRKAANKAGIAPDDLYCARHRFGTDVMKATKDPFLTKLLMGHSDLSTTERYQHPELHHVGGLMDARNQSRLDLCHNLCHRRMKEEAVNAVSD
jgi:site-specific recombinase XerD